MDLKNFTKNLYQTLKLNHRVKKKTRFYATNYSNTETIQQTLKSTKNLPAETWVAEADYPIIPTLLRSYVIAKSVYWTLVLS